MFFCHISFGICLLVHFFITVRYDGTAHPLQEPWKPPTNRYSWHGRGGFSVTVGLKYRPNGHPRPVWNESIKIDDRFWCLAKGSSPLTRARTGCASMPGNPPHLPRASRLCRRVPSPSSSLHLLPPGSPPGKVAGRGLQPRTYFRIGTAERLQERLFKTGGPVVRLPLSFGCLSSAFPMLEIVFAWRVVKIRVSVSG